MTVVALLSAKGSPGVTTTAAALTLAWASRSSGRSALLVDADPIGGDIAAGLLRGAVPASAGMLPLAASRGIAPIQGVVECSVDLRADGSARVLPGVPDGERSGALLLAWDRIREAMPHLESAATDLIVDSGRVERSAGEQPWVDDARAAVLVARPSLPGVAAARRVALAWRRPGTPLHLVVVEAPSPYRPAEVAQAVGLPLLGTIPFDHESARVHSEGRSPGRSFERSAYARAFHHLADRLWTVCSLVVAGDGLVADRGDGTT